MAVSIPTRSSGGGGKLWRRKPALRRSRPQSFRSHAADGLVQCHAELKTIAITLFNVANNILMEGIF